MMQGGVNHGTSPSHTTNNFSTYPPIFIKPQSQGGYSHRSQKIIKKFFLPISPPYHFIVCIIIPVYSYILAVV